MPSHHNINMNVISAFVCQYSKLRVSPPSHDMAQRDILMLRCWVHKLAFHILHHHINNSEVLRWHPDRQL